MFFHPLQEKRQFHPTLKKKLFPIRAFFHKCLLSLNHIRLRIFFAGYIFMVAPYDEKVKRKKIATAFVLSNGSSLALFVERVIARLRRNYEKENHIKR